MIKILVLSVLAVVSLGIVGCAKESATPPPAPAAPYDSKSMTHR